MAYPINTERQVTYLVYVDEVPDVYLSKDGVFRAIKDDQNINSIWRADASDGSFRDVTEDCARDFINKFGEDYDEKKYVPEFVIRQVEDDVDEYFERAAEQDFYEKAHIRALGDVRNYL